MDTIAADHRPSAVTVGCGISILVAVLDAALFGFGLLELQPGTRAYLFMLFSLGSALLMVAAVAAYFRRNWGRVVLIAVSVVDGLLLFADTGWTGVNITLTVLALLGSALLFVPVTNHWYRGARRNRMSGSTDDVPSA